MTTVESLAQTRHLIQAKLTTACCVQLVPVHGENSAVQTSQPTPPPEFPYFFQYAILPRTQGKAAATAAKLSFSHECRQVLLTYCTLQFRSDRPSDDFAAEPLAVRPPPPAAASYCLSTALCVSPNSLTDWLIHPLCNRKYFAVQETTVALNFCKWHAASHRSAASASRQPFHLYSCLTHHYDRSPALTTQCT